MDEMEILAQWHDSRADFWRGEAIVKLPTEAAEHTTAAATIRAAMAENARLRKALTVVRRGRHNNGRPMCRSDVRDIAHAALAAQTKEQDA